MTSTSLLETPGNDSQTTDDTLSLATTIDNPTHSANLRPTYPNFYGIILPLLCFFGVLGNVAAVVVYTRRYMRGSCTTYLTALALCDILFLLAAATMYAPEAFLWVTQGQPPNAGEHLIAYAHIFPLYEMSSAFVSSFTVVATFDHFAFSFKPRQFAKWTTTEAAIKVSVGTIGIVFLIHFLSIFKFQVDEFKVDGRKVVRVCMSTLYQSHSFQILDKFIYFILFDLLPSVLLLLFDFELFRRNRKRVQYDDDDKPMFLFRDGRSTRMIMALGILRIIVSLPYIAISISLYTSTPMFTDSLLCMESSKNIKYATADPLVELSAVVLSVLFSSTKFIIYMLLNSQFRMTFVMLCCCENIEDNDNDDIDLNPVPLVNMRSVQRMRNMSGASSSGSVFTTDSSTRPYVLPSRHPSSEAFHFTDPKQQANRNAKINDQKPSQGHTNINFVGDEEFSDPYESIPSGPRKDVNGHPKLQMNGSRLSEGPQGRLQPVYKPQKSGQTYVVPYRQRRAVPGLVPSSGPNTRGRWSGDLGDPPERPPSPQPLGPTRAVLVRPRTASPPPGKGRPKPQLQRGYDRNEEGSYRIQNYPARGPSSSSMRPPRGRRRREWQV